jgi:hypothetical protein
MEAMTKILTETLMEWSIPVYIIMLTRLFNKLSLSYIFEKFMVTQMFEKCILAQRFNKFMFIQMCDKYMYIVGCSDSNRVPPCWYWYHPISKNTAHPWNTFWRS